MSNDLFQKEEINYRALYGKLFSGLFDQFGANYVSEIEDAIQNTFLKSLKIWNSKSLPNNKENWLFIVARNDVLNQIKTRQKQSNLESFELSDDNQVSENEKDLRLQTIIFIASLEIIGMGLHCFNPGGAFYVFPEIRSTGLTSKEFALGLLEKKSVAVVPGSAFGAAGEGFVRCCYATAPDLIVKAMDLMEEFVNEVRK